MMNSLNSNFRILSIDLSSVITSQTTTKKMYQPSLKQWDEDRKRLRVIYDHSRAKPVERKNKIKKSRQAAFRSVLAERTKPSIQHQDTKSNTSDSSLDKEQSGAHAKRYNRSFGAFTRTEYRENRVYNSWNSTLLLKEPTWAKRHSPCT